MTKPFFAFLLGILCVKSTLAFDTDSAVYISSAKYTYQFFSNKKTSSVEIKQKKVVSYIANDFQASIPVAEVFNNHVSIDDVTYRIDGKSPPYGFKPTYTYYGGDDIFYSDSKVCYFPLIIPKKGGNATVTFEETVNDPRYFTSIYFSDRYATSQKQVEIKIPRWMKVELKEYNFNGYNITKATSYIAGDDADLITYTINNLPAVKNERNSPGPSYLYPHLLVMCKSASVNGQNLIYFNTLADQYSWYKSLIKNTVTDEAVIAAKAKSLTADAKTDMDKIKAIFYYVQDNIRYIAFEDGLAGFRPEQADVVLAKKYGDCKGMANLTKALLTSLGYDAKLCWLGTDHIAYNYDTPSLNVDNHMICALNYDGKTYFLDATETYLGFNQYARRIQGRQVLIENGDNYLLKTVPVADIGQNIDRQTAFLRITDGIITGEVNYLWKGEDKEEILSGINSVKKEKAEDAMMQYLSGNNNDYTITGMKLSGIDNYDKDLEAKYTVKTRNGISSFGKAYYLDMDHTRELIDATIKTDDRQHEYWFAHKTNISREVELALPAGYKVSSLPAPLHIVNANYEFHVKYTAAPAKVTYSKNLLIKNTRLAKSKFTQWNKDIELLAKTYNESLIIKPSSE
ncbi:transglutaminase-like domain-containing protein [Mucilaginibacter sp. 44-25]|uniref:transglutaminase-like domain-containing protein n=1 Tax=Mucilaginibacter sp. 44-25 TaxID=1895794 RepID=UPI000961C7A2|nr:transglutaminase-like domain-containing protein [Mucilaginibacter sp. 44-25]OJW18027.1 MAG: hypothetical protein BGO48_15725 [Mucilaginibacter sp. 44-25]